jgi:hypothetical protein
MNCPRCQIDYNALHWGECPHCGDRHDSEVEGVVKTSTILISSDDGGVFRSIEEVPESLRQILVASTSGANSATIVIADQGGRARIAAALRNLPGDSAAIAPVPLDTPMRVRWHVHGLVWAVLLFACLAGTIAWLLYSRML